MTVLSNYQDPAIWWFRKGFEEAAQMYGEPAVLLSMWNEQNAPEAGIAHCPECWNEVYGQAYPLCPVCFGTGWNGGIRKAWFTNVIRTNPSQKNAVDQKMGRLAGEDAVLDFPWQAELWEFDFALFVNGWKIDPDTGKYAPVEQEAWQIASTPQVKWMKTGSVQYSNVNKIASRADIKRVNVAHPIMTLEWQTLPLLSSSAYFAPTEKGSSSLPVVMASSGIS